MFVYDKNVSCLYSADEKTNEDIYSVDVSDLFNEDRLKRMSERPHVLVNARDYPNNAPVIIGYAHWSGQYVCIQYNSKVDYDQSRLLTVEEIADVIRVVRDYIDLERAPFTLYQHSITENGEFETKKLNAAPKLHDENTLILEDGALSHYLCKDVVDSNDILHAENGVMHTYSMSDDPMPFLNTVKDMLAESIQETLHKLERYETLSSKLDKTIRNVGKENKSVERD